MTETAVRGIRWNFSAREQALPVLAFLLAALLAVTGQAMTAAGAPLAKSAEDMVSVIVRALPGATADSQKVVERSGGEVTRALPVIDGFAATVPASTVNYLESAPAIHSVTVEYQVTPLTATGDMSSTELGSMFNLARMIGADDMWSNGFTGRGVDVALIDTGVAPVNGLQWLGKVVNGPDLSFESQAEHLRHLDAYGHGTAMAGVIAGRDNEITDPATNRGAGFQGVAPDAGIVNVKVGAANGAVDVSQVIAAIDWVVQHRNAPGLNIRVLNLSYGTDSTQSWQTDPLSYAAEVAWRKGIVVVAATGNDGRGTGLAMPAQNPYIIAVGASDHAGTQDVSDDRVASFSTYANGQRRPDFLAPGVGVVGLRAEGSYLDGQFPQAVRGERFFRGSGTSQAAAVTSGAVALLLQQRPNLTPDQVKQLLRNTASSLRGTSNNAQGAGLINLRNARTASTPSAGLPSHGTSSGQGSLESSRGSSHVAMDGVELRGEKDIFGTPWNSVRWTADSWNGSSWNDGVWNSVRWTGSGWNSEDWASVRWTSVRWTGEDWTSVRWTGDEWTSVRWTNDDWSSVRWTSVRWTGSSWTGATWEDDLWNSVRWTSVRWTGDDIWNSVRWTSVRWTSVRWTGQWATGGWH